MKKILAITLAVAMLFTLSVTAFATVSPTAKEEYKIVEVDPKNDPKVIVYEVQDPGKEKQVLAFSADEEITTKDKQGKESSAKFKKWTIYKKDGSLAVLGVDYDFVEGFDIYSRDIKIIPHGDLIIAADYGDEPTDITDAKKKFEEESPKDGDVASVAFAAVACVALAGVCVSKKYLGK